MSAHLPQPDRPSSPAQALPWQPARATQHLRHQGLDAHDAEDCAQDAALRLVDALARGRVREVRPGFLARLLNHARIDHWRRAQVRRKHVVEATGAEAPVAGSVDPGDRLDLAEALATLPDAQREVLRLTVHQGLAYADAAERLGVPVGTVKSRVSRALAALRERLA